MTRFSPARYQTPVAGEVVADIFLPQIPRFEAMLEVALCEALMQAKDVGVQQDQLRRALVVMATTKGDLKNLEQYVRSASGTWPDGVQEPARRGRFWERFDLTGPAHMVSLACASGAAAIAYAAESLESGCHDTAVVVGIDELSDFILTGFSSLKSLDPEPCRPFDRERKGLSLGEAAAVMVLTAPGSLPSAPLGRVLGWGFANDATHLTAPNREGTGLALACNHALDKAGLTPGDIHYINAHGTGTAYNDAMEAKAVAKVFGLPGPPLSTLKGTTGHTLGAAGVLEAIATLECLQRKSAPPTRGLETSGVDEALDLIQHTPRPLPEGAKALSLSAGFGGFNAVLVLGSAA
jgi:3-oxoacyl-[acyl-carrier-protein] synthase II